jgi:hypothetical protein
MALVVKDRVQVTSTTEGTGAFTLGSAAIGFQDFSVIGNGNTTYYAITSTTDWEVGIGTYTSAGPQLVRDTILESSNSGSAVNFGPGIKNVFCTYPAEKAVYLDGSGNAIGLGTPPSINLTNASDLPLTTGVTGTLHVDNGGTNITTYTIGDILYASATDTLSKLTIGTNGYVLASNGTIPNWIDLPDQPIISSVSPSSFSGASGSSFTITGTGFHSGAQVTFVGSDNTLFTASTTTFDSTTQLTAVTPAAFPLSKSPYGITVTQLSGATTTRTALITAGSAPTWTTASGSLGSFAETSSVSVTVVATDPDGGAITYSLVSGSFPSGITLNGSTGVISGTAPGETVDTTYSFTIRATDVATNTTDRVFSITILDNIPPTWVTPAGSLGTVYDLSRTGASFTVQATDVQTVTYSVQSGALPTGMSLNSSTGVISGTPNAVGSNTTYNFDIRASDGTLSADRSFSITVNAPSATLYTSGSGTYTTLAGQTTIRATVAAGGGGGSTTSCGGQRYAAGGGGGAAQRTYSGLTPVGGVGYSYSVGAGGTGFNYGGACEPPGGGTGGTSSFGPISASGGGGGRSGVPGNGYTEVGGGGGSGSGGDTNQSGGSGGTGSGGQGGARTALASAVGSYSRGGNSPGVTGEGGFVRIEV